MKIEDILKELETVTMLPYQRIDEVGTTRLITDEQAKGYKLALEDVKRLLKE